MNKEEIERGIISVTPEVIKPQGRVRRNSTGRVNTWSSPSLSISGEKVLPHYLRASTSSCHDFCKYGTKHVFEAKIRNPKPPTFHGSNKTPDEELIQAKVLTQRVSRKKPELKPTPKSQPKNQLSEKSKLVRHDAVTPLAKEGSSDEPGSMAVTPSPFDENISSRQVEASSEEPISIKLVISTNEAERLSEEPVSINLQSPPSLDWSKGSSDGSENMELDSPSPKPTVPVNQAEGSSEQTVGFEPMTPSPAPADESTGMELKTPPSTEKSSISSEHEPARQGKASCRQPVSLKLKTPPSTNKSNKSSMEALSRKLKTPPPIRTRIESAANRAEELAEENNQLKILKNREVSKLKFAQGLKTEVSPSRPKLIKQEKVEVTGEPKTIKKKISSPVKKVMSSVKPKFTDQQSPTTIKKAVASVSPRVIKLKALLPPKRTDVLAKSAISLKPKSIVANPSSARISLGRLTAQKNHGNKLIRSADLSNLGKEKLLKPSRGSLPPNPSVNGVSTRKFGNFKPASPVKSRVRVGKVERTSEKIKEKTLYVIEPMPKKSGKEKYYSSQTLSVTSSTSSPSSVSSHEKEEHNYSDSTLSEASELVTKRIKPVCSPKGEKKGRLRRTTTVSSEDKVPTPHKLKFRRGKVVSPRSENNGPKKLRFRQAKGPSNNQNCKGEVGKRSFRKKIESVGQDLNPPSSENPTVVLRHQDVQQKKDSQGLFNHVIEETASKLAEARKGKVKALVGAFETVISLQESRVAPTV